MDLGLRGETLQSVLIEYAVRLQLSADYFIVIESPFELELQNDSFWLSPDEESEGARQVLNQLIGDTIEEVEADEAGSLRVTFASTARLTVEADAEFEAWTVSGPDGVLVVSTPGGDLSSWPRRGNQR